MKRQNVMGMIACAATLAVSQTSFGQLSLTGNSYLQDFNGIAAGLPAGFTGRTAASATSLGAQVSFNASNVGTWGTTTGQFKNFASATVGSGASATVQQNAADRAFGVRPTGSFGDPGAAFTLQISNTLGLSNFTLSLDAQLLDPQGRSQTDTLQYGLGAAPSSFVDLATYNDPGVFGTTNISIPSSALTGIANQGQNVWLRFATLAPSVGGGSRDTVAIDNLALSWTGTPVIVGTPRNLVYNSGNFEAPNAFLDGGTPATFDSLRPDNAIFSQAGAPSLVTIGTGVTTGSLDFEATAPVTTLTGGTITVTGAATFNQSVVLNTNYIASGTGSQTFAVATGKTVNVNTGLAGQTLNKLGAGTLFLNAAATNFTGGIVINGGAVVATAADGLGNSGLGIGSLSVNAGTLQLASITLGTSSTSTAPQITLNNNSTLVATGTSSYGRSSAALTIGNGTTTTQNSVVISTPSVNDSLTLGNSVRQNSAGSLNTFATVHKTGAGKLVFLSGGTTATSGFAGNWSLEGGITQLGPAESGGFGEPLNALGQVGTFTAGNAVAVAGGILALATNTANTLTSGSDFPTSIRNPLLLSGGTLAAISSGSLDETNGNGAQFSGNINFAAGVTSGILLTDPTSPGTNHNVLLVSNPGLAGNLIWGGSSTLNVTGGGAFTVNRFSETGGTVTVGAGALVSVSSASTMNLEGSLDAFSDGSGNFVGIANAGSFNVLASNAKNVGAITGAGTTTISDGATLTFGGAKQGGLALNGAAVATVRAGATPNTPANTSVVGTLSIGGTPSSPTAKLDLTNNTLVEDYTGSVGTAVTDTRLLLLAGVNSGGSVGLVSSSKVAASPGVFATTLGYGDTAVIGAGTYSGVSVDATSLVIKFTYAGDSNLDGKVDITDLGNLASHFQQAATWTGGDFNYDGFVNITDLGILATNFQAGVGGPLFNQQSFNEALAQVAAEYNSTVPEPTSLSLIAGAGLLSLRRRRSL